MITAQELRLVVPANLSEDDKNNVRISLASFMSLFNNSALRGRGVPTNTADVFKMRWKPIKGANISSMTLGMTLMMEVGDYNPNRPDIMDAVLSAAGFYQVSKEGSTRLPLVNLASMARK